MTFRYSNITIDLHYHGIKMWNIQAYLNSPTISSIYCKQVLSLNHNISYKKEFDTFLPA